MSRLRIAGTSTLIALLGLAAGGLSACSSSKNTEGERRSGAKLAASADRARATEATAVALCSAIHELSSRRRAACCGEPPLRIYFDECVRLLSASVRASSVSIEKSKIEQCASRVAEETRGCDWVGPTLAAPPADCAGAVVGLVAEGGRCNSSLECRDALHCAGQGATSPGRCTAPTGPGGACGASVDPLATYLGVRALEKRKPPCAAFCNLTTHRCVDEPVLGAACTASVNCALDQACRDGRCVALEPAKMGARSRPGEACATDFDCVAGGCVADATGRRSCAKKCSSGSGSLAGRPSLGSMLLGRSASKRSTSRTSTASESASR